jgi:hypothetical protein
MKEFKEALPSIFAGIIAILGLVMIYDMIARSLISSDAGLAIIGPVIGTAVAFVFQRGAISDTAKAVTNGAATAAVARAREMLG